MKKILAILGNTRKDSANQRLTEVMSGLTKERFEYKNPSEYENC